MFQTDNQRISFRPRPIDLVSIATIRNVARKKRGADLTVSDAIRESLQEHARTLITCHEP